MSFLGSTGCHSALMPKVSRLLWVSQAAGLEKGERAASAQGKAWMEPCFLTSGGASSVRSTGRAAPEAETKARE